MKKQILIGLSILGISIVFLLLYFQTYSISEITADNFNKKLKENEQSIWSCMLDDYNPDRISLWSYGNDYKVIQPIFVNVEENKLSNDKKSIIISNTPSSLIYNIIYKKLKDGEIKVPIRCFIENYKSNPSVILMLEKLILERQFILLKSQMISGHDILIKDNNSDFIIIELNGKFEYNNPPMGLNISTFSKKKYFNFY